MPDPHHHPARPQLGIKTNLGASGHREWGNSQDWPLAIENTAIYEYAALILDRGRSINF